MKIVKDIIRMIIISFEFVWLLISILFLMYFSNVIMSLFHKLFIGPDRNWQLVFLLVATYLGSSLYFARLLLFPREKNKVLYEWPDFVELYRRVAYSVCLCILSSAITFMLFAFSDYVSLLFGGLLYWCFTGASFIALASLIFASMKIRIVLEQYTKDENINRK